MFFFTFSMVEHSGTEKRRSRKKKMQSRVTFPDFSPFLFSYSKSDTASVVVSALLCLYLLFANSNVTFHVKHCKINKKYFNIIPVI